MTQRTQFDRSYVSGAEVSASQPEGTPFYNFVDRRLQIKGSFLPVDVLPIRPFSDQADYESGDIVVYNGGIYAALAPITAGAFNAADWTSLVADVFSPLTGTVGWDFTLTYTGDDVTEVLSSNADSRVRQTLTYDAEGNPETIFYETSVNAGVDWTSLGTLTITYDADGNPQSGAWT